MAKKAAKKKAPAKKKPASKAKKVSAKPHRSAAPTKPSYKPQGVGDVIPNLILRNAAAAIDFYKSVFGAKELRRFNMPGDKVGHAELRIGDTIIFLNDESPMGSGVAASPEHKSTFTIQLYVPDVDATYNRALKAGAKSTMAVADMFWGDRMSSITDPFGQLWAISTKVKDMTDAEMTKAGEDFMKQFGQGGPPGAPSAS
jgi:uncharacterized glyoxalase superfamily protein PhnB